MVNHTARKYIKYDRIGQVSNPWENHQKKYICYESKINYIGISKNTYAINVK